MKTHHYRALRATEVLEEEFTLGDPHMVDELMADIDGDSTWTQTAVCQASPALAQILCPDPRPQRLPGHGVSAIPA